MYKFVLASASPRRIALLANLGLQFEIIKTQIDEHKDGDPKSVAISNAQKKCETAMLKVTPPAIVIAADTIVHFNGKILNKPNNINEAQEMLTLLSGNTHEVITGLCVGKTEEHQILADCEITRVTFRNLLKEEINRFIEVVQPFDRAGAYTVDGPGSLLVSRYEGCFYNVLGLPIVRLDYLLKHFEINLFDEINMELARFL